MRIAFFLLAMSLIFAGCNGATSTNPGGHSPEEIARLERQGPPPDRQASQTAAPQDDSATGPADGRRLFGQYCAPCHAEGKSAPSLAGVFQRSELPSGTPANDARVKETIKQGRAMMPAFQGVLSDAQVNAIVAYLHTI